jgi:F-type H+-transporting ATPase subunit delta
MAQSQVKPEHVLNPATALLSAEYAAALMGLAPDTPSAEAIAEELDAIAGLVAQVQGLQSLLESAVLSGDKAKAMVDRVFKDRVSDLACSFLGVLAAHGRLGLLRQTAAQFHKLLNERKNLVGVSVTSAKPLEDSQLEAVRVAMREILAAEPLVSSNVDPSILGGLKIRIGDRVYDASLASQLHRLCEELVSREIRWKAQP